MTLKHIANYSHECQGPDLMEVIQLAKEEAQILGRPLDKQFMKYLFLRGAYANHDNYLEEFNGWLNDKNLDELQMTTSYQELVLRTRKVDLQQCF
jgi:hypothetical protein